MTPRFDLSPSIYLLAVVVAILALIGFGILLSSLRNLRRQLADELRRELRTDEEAKRIDVQQPLIVQPHTEYATAAALKQVEKEAHGRMSRERDETNARIEKIDAKLDANTAMTSEMRGEVRQMNQNVSMLQGSLNNFMRDQARTV